MTEDIADRARKEVERRHPSWHDRGVGIVQGSHYRSGFVAGAEWAAEAQAQRITEADQARESESAAADVLALKLNDALARAEAAEAERDALAAQIAEARAEVSSFGAGWPLMTDRERSNYVSRFVTEAKRILSAPTPDALNRVRAEAWDEGAQWAAGEFSERYEFEPFLAPGDNPYRIEAAHD